MPLVDWLMLGVMLLSMLAGALRGLVYELLSVVAWIASFLLAQWLAPEVAPSMPMGNASPALRMAVTFAVLFALGVFAGGFIAFVVKKMIDAIGLRPADRSLGLLFGAARGAILLMAVAAVIGMTTLRTASWWQESHAVPVLQAMLRGITPMMPDAFARYLR